MRGADRGATALGAAVEAPLTTSLVAAPTPAEVKAAAEHAIRAAGLAAKRALVATGQGCAAGERWAVVMVHLVYG